MSEFHFGTLLLEKGARVGSTCLASSLKEREASHSGLGLIVGEAPSRREQSGASRPGEPLTHESRVGARLLSLLGCSVQTYYRLFDRANLLGTQHATGVEHAGDFFDALAAERSAHELIRHVIQRQYWLVIMLGKRVRYAITSALNDRKLCSEPLQLSWTPTIRTAWMTLPHPSGTNHHWNSEEHRHAAKSVLVRLVDHLLLAEDRPGETP